MRSPIRLTVDEKLTRALGKKVRVWTCDDERLDVAQLQHRTQPQLTVILHRSTKSAGKWQGSFFDHGEPTRDFQEASCARLLRELPASRWRLRQVVAR